MHGAEERAEPARHHDHHDQGEQQVQHHVGRRSGGAELIFRLLREGVGAAADSARVLVSNGVEAIANYLARAD